MDRVEFTHGHALHRATLGEHIVDFDLESGDWRFESIDFIFVSQTYMTLTTAKTYAAALLLGMSSQKESGQ